MVHAAHYFYRACNGRALLRYMLHTISIERVPGELSCDTCYTLFLSSVYRESFLAIHAGYYCCRACTGRALLRHMLLHFFYRVCTGRTLLRGIPHTISIEHVPVELSYGNVKLLFHSSLYR